jgi:hypothetical protein
MDRDEQSRFCASGRLHYGPSAEQLEIAVTTERSIDAADPGDRRFAYRSARVVWAD